MEVLRASTVRSVKKSDVRDAWIDALRGFAVFSMFGANLAPYALQAPQPLWFRVWASTAAPIFVFLAGYSVGWRAGSRPLWSYAKRGTTLITIAALLDWACWGVTPFTTFDVLYVIGISIPAAAWLVRLARHWQLAVTAAPVLATPLLHRIIGYGSDAPSPFLDAVQAFFVDGWFPVCPWLGLSLCGAVVGQLRSRDGYRSQLGWAGGLAMIAGLVLRSFRPTPTPTRQGYVELFYPPSASFVLIGVGFILLTLTVLPRWRPGRISKLLAVYSRRALLLYVAHTFALAMLLKRFVRPQGMFSFLLLYAVFAAALWFLAQSVSPGLGLLQTAFARVRTSSTEGEPPDMQPGRVHGPGPKS